MLSQLIVICSAGLLALGGIWVLISGFDDDDNDGDGMTFLIKWKRKEKFLMAGVKLNSDSDDVGTKFKIIGISVTLGLNAIVFIWYFFFSGLT